MFGRLDHNRRGGREQRDADCGKIRGGGRITKVNVEGLFLKGRTMTRVIVNETLRTMLHNLAEPLELCDESGNVLARLTPTANPSLYEGLEPRITREEFRRRKQNKGKTYTTAEVLAHLEKL